MILQNFDEIKKLHDEVEFFTICNEQANTEKTELSNNTYV